MRRREEDVWMMIFSLEDGVLYKKPNGRKGQPLVTGHRRLLLLHFSAQTRSRTLGARFSRSDEVSERRVGDSRKRRRYQTLWRLRRVRATSSNLPRWKLRSNERARARIFASIRKTRLFLVSRSVRSFGRWLPNLSRRTRLKDERFSSSRKSPRASR